MSGLVQKEYQTKRHNISMHSIRRIKEKIQIAYHLIKQHQSCKCSPIARTSSETEGKTTQFTFLKAAGDKILMGEHVKQGSYTYQ